MSAGIRRVDIVGGMEAASLIAFGFFVVLGPLVGVMIGRPKGRGVAGFFLGLFGGVIGWIIVGALPRRPAKEAEHQAKVEAARSGVPKSKSKRYPCWAVDPFVRNELRYFDGRWTERVSNSGAETVDPPTFPPPDGLVDGSGWAPDPFHRFATRFFHDGRWTSHVNSGDSLMEDPPQFPAPQHL